MVDVLASGIGTVASGAATVQAPNPWTATGFLISADNFAGSSAKLISKWMGMYDPRFDSERSWTIGGNISQKLTGDPIGYDVLGVFVGGANSFIGIKSFSTLQKFSGVVDGVNATYTGVKVGVQFDNKE